MTFSQRRTIGFDRVARMLEITEVVGHRNTFKLTRTKTMKFHFICDYDAQMYTLPLGL